MPASREDYLLRMIERIAALARRLREKLRDDPTGDEAEGVAREAGAAIGELLGPQAGMLGQLDATTAVGLVGAADRAAMWIDLLGVQAEAARAAGDEARAARLEARSAALREAAARRWPA